MSISAMQLVWANSVAKGTARVVMLALADHADENMMCYPSLSRLAQYANVDRRNVIEAIGKLTAMGEISKTQRSTHRNIYQITLSASNEIVTSKKGKSGDGDATSDNTPTSDGNITKQENPTSDEIVTSLVTEPSPTSDEIVTSLVTEPSPTSDEIVTSLVTESSPKPSINHQELLNNPNTAHVRERGQLSDIFAPRLYAVTAEPPKPAEHRAEKHKPERPPPPDALAQALTKAVVLWNETAERHGLPAVTKLTKPRGQKLKARLAALATPDDPDGLAGWEKALKRVQQSDFLLGRTGKGWRANFDFLVNPNKFQQVIEGAYDPPPKSRAISGAGPPRGIGIAAQIQRVANEYFQEQMSETHGPEN